MITEDQNGPNSGWNKTWLIEIYQGGWRKLVLRQFFSEKIKLSTKRQFLKTANIGGKYAC